MPTDIKLYQMFGGEKVSDKSVSQCLKTSRSLHYREMLPYISNRNTAYYYSKGSTPAMRVSMQCCLFEGQ